MPDHNGQNDVKLAPMYLSGGIPIPKSQVSHLEIRFHQRGVTHSPWQAALSKCARAKAAGRRLRLGDRRRDLKHGSDRRHEPPRPPRLSRGLPEHKRGPLRRAHTLGGESEDGRFHNGADAAQRLPADGTERPGSPHGKGRGSVPTRQDTKAAFRGAFRRHSHRRESANRQLLLQMRPLRPCQGGMQHRV